MLFRTKLRPAPVPAMRPVPPLPAPIAPSRQPFPLDMALMKWSSRDIFTLRMAVEGTEIWGSPGAAKSSSSGRALAHAFLRSDFGGLVLCAKPSERDTWLRYAAETGRSDSVVVFDGSGRHRFNFLDYECRRSGTFVAKNLVELFSTMMEAARGGENAVGGDNQIWTDLTKELLSHTFSLLYSAWGNITLDALTAVIDSAPQSVEEGHSEQWRRSSFCFRSILKMVESPEHRLSAPDEKTTGDFFRQKWARRHGKMRTSIEANLTASIYPFQTGYLRELFCTQTTMVPEATHEGAIIILDLPIKTHGSAGILAQQIWKFLFQRAAERRHSDLMTRPVILWADECQYFINSYDREFMGTARSSKCCAVYITQNLPTLYSAMKGSNSRDTVNALNGLFQNQIFHQNNDADTNRYASDIINKKWQWIESVGKTDNTSISEGGNKSFTSGGSYSYSGGFSSNTGNSKGITSSESQSAGTSRSASQQMHEELLPSTFTSLRKGGGRLPPEAIVMQGGTPFALTGRNWLRCQILQG